MVLSKRLECISQLVTVKSSIVDVGTDHGFLPIAMVSRGQIKRAVAADLRKGPLAGAEKNIAEKGLSDRIRTRLSDGLSNIEAGEGEALVISGMGGNLITEILRRDHTKAVSFKEWVLSPQSDNDRLLSYVYEAGFHIEAQADLYEDGKYYFMFRAVEGHRDIPEDPAFPYGHLLVKDHDSVLFEHLSKLLTEKEEVLLHLRDLESEKVKRRRIEISREIQELKEVLKQYEMQ